MRAAQRTPTAVPARASFAARVEQRGPDECWLWHGAKNREGYGRYLAHYAHRIAYVLAHGELSDGLTVDHLCRYRDCVNPVHLEAVTARENWERGRRVPETSCPGAATRHRSPARFHRRRARGLCVQCNTPSEKYRCDRCREIHNARNKGRAR